MQLRPRTDLSRAEKEELLALLEERNRRREARRVAEQRDAILAKCQTLHGFIEEFWYVLEPTAPYVTGWAVRAMCDHLEAVHYGWIQDLLITVPPGMMKSLLVSVFFQAWEWGPMGRPDLRYLATSFSDENVARDSNKVRKLIESEKFQALWGDKVRPGKRWGVYNFENAAGGNRDCRPFGSLTGGRGDRVLIDDPHSVKTSESDTQREETVRLYREGATDRLNDVQRSATIVIMQRLHEKDVAGTILELGGFVHLNLPMEYEPERRCVTVLRPANDGNPAILFEDPRTTAGELLFPERFPAANIAKLKRRKGSFAWAGQYQQRPAPRDGGLFKRHWFRFVDRLPPADDWAYCRAWDFGATDGSGDYTVGCLLAHSETLELFVVLSVVRGQMGPAAVDLLLKTTAGQDGFGVTQHLPQDPGAAGKSDNLSKVKLLVGHDVQSNRPTGSKVQRARPAVSQTEAGAVLLLRSPWNEEFMDELCTFPASANDDQVDAFADAFNHLAVGGVGKHKFAFA